MTVNKDKIFDNRGFTLLELLVSAALFGITMLMVSRVTVDVLRMQVRLNKYKECQAIYDTLVYGFKGEFSDIDRLVIVDAELYDPESTADANGNLLDFDYIQVDLSHSWWNDLTADETYAEQRGPFFEVSVFFERVTDTSVRLIVNIDDPAESEDYSEQLFRRRIFSGSTIIRCEKMRVYGGEIEFKTVADGITTVNPLVFLDAD